MSAPPRSDAWLTTRGLHRHYRRAGHVVRALDGVDLVVGRGDFVAVVGASGSGKSTLLNLLAGLDRPTAGEVRVAGEALHGRDRRRLARWRGRRVGVVFQSFQLLGHLTALRNVELALAFAGHPRARRQDRAAAILGELGLGERLDHRPADLSGGEQQRVALARALVKEPDLLLADEPTGNLDRDSAAAVAGILAASHARGVTIVMVTHDADLASRLAQSRIRLEYGKRVEDRS